LKKNIKVIIPAFNEAEAIAKVIAEIPKDLVSEIIVVNNNSRDETSKVAKDSGATVLNEPRQGYGYACLAGLAYIKNNPCDIVAPIVNDDYDFVIGSRALGNKESGSMTPQQIFGNWLATRLIKLFFGTVYTDLGPFRAIKYQKLMQMNMIDTTYGWTVEMQLKAAKQNLKLIEVPVNYRNRIGHSKVSGTLKGTVMAGYKILTWIFKYALK
jgi:glycosyltransferase involved in cell wall biosynthesis